MLLQAIPNGTAHRPHLTSPLNLTVYTLLCHSQESGIIYILSFKLTHSLIVLNCGGVVVTQCISIRLTVCLS